MKTSDYLHYPKVALELQFTFSINRSFPMHTFHAHTPRRSGFHSSAYTGFWWTNWYWDLVLVNTQLIYTNISLTYHRRHIILSIDTIVKRNIESTHWTWPDVLAAKSNKISSLTTGIEYDYMYLTSRSEANKCQIRFLLRY